MTGYLVILVCVLGIIFERKLQKKFGVLSLFGILWILIISLAEMSLFDMNEVSEKIYVELFLGTFSFISIYLAGRFGVIKGLNSVRLKVNTASIRHTDYSFNLKIIYVLEIITLIGWIYVALQCFVALGSGLSLEQFRNIYLNRGAYSIFPSGLFELYIKRFCAANILMFVPLVIVMIFERNKRYFKAIILAIVCIALNQLVTGGRMAFIYMLADILIAMSIYKVALPKKWKKRIFWAAIMLIGCVLFITILRKRILETGNWELLYENTYIYFTLCIPLADYWMQWIDANNYLTLGVGTFSGLINLVNIFTSNIFGYTLKAAETVANVFSPVEENYIYVFKEASCNAYVTWIFQLYADFREFGVIVGSGIFGWFSGRIARNAYHGMKTYSIALLLLVVQAIVKTFVRWEFSVEAYILAFLFLRICFRKKVNGDNDGEK